MTDSRVRNPLRVHQETESIVQKEITACAVN